MPILIDLLYRALLFSNSFLKDEKYKWRVDSGAPPRADTIVLPQAKRSSYLHPLRLCSLEGASRRRIERRVISKKKTAGSLKTEKARS